MIIIHGSEGKNICFVLFSENNASLSLMNEVVVNNKSCIINSLIKLILMPIDYSQILKFTWSRIDFLNIFTDEFNESAGWRIAKYNEAIGLLTKRKKKIHIHRKVQGYIEGKQIFRKKKYMFLKYLKVYLL